MPPLVGARIAGFELLVIKPGSQRIWWTIMGTSCGKLRSNLNAYLYGEMNPDKGATLGRCRKICPSILSKTIG